MEGVVEAPVFRPTPEQFQDPLRYISTVVRPAAQDTAGIARIVPPPGWRVPFSLPQQESFTFTPRVQTLNALEATVRAHGQFVTDLRIYNFMTGRPLKPPFPRYNDQPVDMRQLFVNVVGRGGYYAVTDAKSWDEVAAAVTPAPRPVPTGKSSKKGRKKGPTAPPAPAPGTDIRDAYNTFLLAYERHLFPDLERPAGDGDAPLPPAPTPAPSPPPPTTSRRPPEIELGMTFYRQLPDTEDVYEARVERYARRPTASKEALYVVSHKGAPDERVPAGDLEIYVANGDTPEAAHMAFDQDICQVCLRADCEDRLMLCDNPFCESAYHTFCLEAPLAAVPDGDWFCAACVAHHAASVDDRRVDFHKATYPLAAPTFGFDDGSAQTIEEFTEFANDLKREYFNVRRLSDVRAPDVDREFWRCVGTPAHEQLFRVEYGSDIDTHVNGSGFPRAAPGGDAGDSVDPYATSGWNLNNLPVLPGSVLQYIGGSITGITTPWLYMGMVFSSFCWHKEDHNLYSINYVHWGDHKRWFGVPGAAAGAFEKVVEELAPELFATQPDLLYQLVTMVSPAALTSRGVPVTTTLQRAGEFVITFPKAYHGGYNHGLNCAEAVNFATPDWFAWGVDAEARYRALHKTPVFSHEGFLYVVSSIAIKSYKEAPTTSAELLPHVRAAFAAYKAGVAAVFAAGVTQEAPIVLVGVPEAAHKERYGVKPRTVGDKAGDQAGDKGGDGAAAGAGGAVPPATRKKGGKAKKAPAVAAPPPPPPGTPAPLTLTVIKPPKARRRGAAARFRQRAAKVTDVAAANVMRGERLRVTSADNANPLKGLRCHTCKQYTFLAQVTCTACALPPSASIVASSKSPRSVFEQAVWVPPGDAASVVVLCLEHAAAELPCGHSVSERCVRRKCSDAHLDGVVAALEKRAGAPDAWRAARDAALAQHTTHGCRATLDTVERLLKRADHRNLGVAPAEVAELEAAVAATLKWQAEAEAALPVAHLTRTSTEQVVMVPVEELLGVVATLRDVPLLVAGPMTRLASVVLRLDAWQRAARRCLGASGEEPTAVAPAMDACLALSRELLAAQGLARQQSICPKELPPNPAATAAMYNTADAEKLAADTLILPVRLPETAAVCSVQKWAAWGRRAATAKRLLDSFAGGARSAVVVGGDAYLAPVPATPRKHMRLVELEVVMDAMPSAEGVPPAAVPTDAVECLQAAAATGRQVCDNVLPLLDSASTPTQLREALDTVTAFPLDLTVEARLRSRLDRLAKWMRRARATLAAIDAAVDTTDRVPLSRVGDILKTAHTLNVPAGVAEVARLQELHAAAEAGRQRVLASVATKGVRGGPTAVLAAAAKRLKVIAQELAADARDANTEQLFCVCRLPHADGVFMVSCDSCSEWFHPACVGLKASTIRGGVFTCPQCCEAKGVPVMGAGAPAEPLYCLCRTPWGEDDVLVSCDFCDNWYHPGCVRLEEAAARGAAEYRCQACCLRLGISEKHPPEDLGVGPPVLGRPPVEALEACLAHLQRVGLAAPEEDTLRALVAAVRAHECRTHSCLATYRRAAPGGKWKGVPFGAALRMLYQESVAMDVVPGTSADLLDAVWDHRAAMLLSGPKPSLATCHALAAGVNLQAVPDADHTPTQARLAGLLTRAGEWLDAARDVVESRPRPQPPSKRRGGARVAASDAGPSPDQVAAATKLLGTMADLGVKLLPPEAVGEDEGSDVEDGRGPEGEVEVLVRGLRRVAAC